MTIKEWLKNTSNKLKGAGISTARLDCLILLEDATGKDRAWLLAHPKTNLNTLTPKPTILRKGQTLAQLDELVERRARHEPLAYIRGKSAFYGREFFVNKHTLQPRPETETMIELLKELVVSSQLTVVRNSKTEHGKQNTENNNLQIVDVGTGSGCVAITAKLELPNYKVIATDISHPCLEIAQKNAKQLNADITFMQTNLVSGLEASELDHAILCCNLPYVPDSFTINQAAMFEPDIAIFGGKDGLDYYRQLFDQLKSNNSNVRAILTESLPTQHKALEKITKNHGFKLEKTQDFIQIFTPNK